jgi:hypothetical protein
MRAGNSGAVSAAFSNRIRMATNSAAMARVRCCVWPAETPCARGVAQVASREIGAVDRTDENGKPSARTGRKITGLPESAGLPNRSPGSPRDLRSASPATRMSRHEGRRRVRSYTLVVERQHAPASARSTGGRFGSSIPSTSTFGSPRPLPAALRAAFGFCRPSSSVPWEEQSEGAT